MEVANSILVETAPAVGAGNAQIASGEVTAGLFAVTLEEMISNLSTKIGLIDKFLANFDEAAGTGIESNQEGEANTDEVVAVKSEDMRKPLQSNVEIAAQGSVISELVSNMMANTTLKQVVEEKSNRILVENVEMRLDPIGNIGGSLREGFANQAVQTVLAETLDAGGVTPDNTSASNLSASVATNNLLSEELTNLFQPANDEITVSNVANPVVTNPVVTNEGEKTVPESKGNPVSTPPQTGSSFIVDKESSSAMIVPAYDGELDKVDSDEKKAKDGNAVTRMMPEKTTARIESDGVSGKTDVSNGFEVRALLRELIPEKHQLIESLRLNDQLKPSFAVTNNAAGTGDKTYLQVPVRDVVQQMVDQIALIVSQDKSNARIQLKPEFLGELKVRIDLTGNQVTAKLEAASSIAKELLETGVAQVKQALQSHGLKVDDVIVQLRGDQSKQANHERFGGGNQDGEHGNGRQRRFSEEQEEKQRRYLLGGLNEWVA